MTRPGAGLSAVPPLRPYKDVTETYQWSGLFFNGKTDYVRIIDNATLDLTDHATFGAIFKNLSNGTFFIPPIIGRTDVAGKWTTMGFFGTPQHILVLGYEGIFVLPFVTAVNNEWIRTIGTIDAGGILKMYKDAILEGQGLAPPYTSTDGDWFVGGNVLVGIFNSFANVVISEVYIIAETLNESDIFTLTKGTKFPTQFDCRLWHDYRLGNARDLSGYGNDGQIVGAVFQK